MDAGGIATEVEWLVPLGVGLAFVILWAPIFRGVAQLSGWRALAAAYPPVGIPGAGLGERFRMRSIQLRYGINYNSYVTLTAGPACLRLTIPRLIGWGHPPIEVPWTEITAERGRILFLPSVTLRCARVPAVPVSTSRRLAERLARASGGQLRLPDVAVERG